MQDHSPVSVFCSYAHEDEHYLEALRSHLAGLRRQGLMKDWNDRKIPSGDEWEPAISRELEDAGLILLLISPDFIDSDYCMEVETARALERQAAGEAKVIPVFVRECMIDGLSFAKLQGTPRKCRWIATQSNRDKAYYEVAVAIRDAVWQKRGYNRGTRLALNAIKPIDNTRWLWIQRVVFVVSAIALLVAPDIWLSHTVDQPLNFNKAFISSGMALLDQGEFAQAKADCGLALKHLPQSRYAKICIAVTELWSSNLPREGFATRGGAVEKMDPDARSYVIDIQGQLAAAEENLSEAQGFFQEALSLNPKLADGYYGLGQVAHLQKKFETASDNYEKALDLAPANRRYRLNLASALSEGGHLETAQTRYENLINQDTDLLLAQVELIDLLLLQGNLKVAGARAEDLYRQIKNKPKIWSLPLNNAKWFFNTNMGPIYLKRDSGKKSYVLFQVALCNYLLHRFGNMEMNIGEIQRDAIEADQALILISYKIWRLTERWGGEELFAVFRQSANIPEWLANQGALPLNRYANAITSATAT